MAKGRGPIGRETTNSLLSIDPEYLNVLGPSAKVNGRGPDIWQSFVSAQKTVYVVAVLSCGGISTTCES